MGISSNQARFLSLTSRQVDLEFRIQQICQRRLRLASELENVATSYNNKISNRQLYTMNTSNSGISNMYLDPNGGIHGILDPNNLQYGAVIKARQGSLQGQWTGMTFAPSGDTAFNIWNSGGTITFSELGLPQTASQHQVLDAALRSGLIGLAVGANEFTQTETPVYSSSGSAYQMELKDWRTVPALADELYNGDDVDAENKYDKTIEEINAQDKKLQLEQTSIEVEYKAVSSERESVKKILDQNAQSSFKYFS